MLNSSFEIHHSWGDPREPEYKNDSKVSYAYYKSGNVHLSFSMYSKKSNGNTSIVMEVPVNIRLLLGNKWSNCETVIQRVVEHLKALDESESHRKYDNIVLDTSKAAKWWPTQIKLFEKNYPFLFDTLPTARTSSLIALGLTTGYQKEYHMIDRLTPEITDWTLFVAGMSIMGILFLDIYKR
jgi:hypothetical protein